MNEDTDVSTEITVADASEAPRTYSQAEWDSLNHTFATYLGEVVANRIAEGFHKLPATMLDYLRDLSGVGFMLPPIQLGYPTQKYPVSYTLLIDFLPNGGGIRMVIKDINNQIAWQTALSV